MGRILEMIYSLLSVVVKIKTCGDAFGNYFLTFNFLVKLKA